MSKWKFRVRPDSPMVPLAMGMLVALAVIGVILFVTLASGGGK